MPGKQQNVPYYAVRLFVSTDPKLENPRISSI